MTNFSSTLRRFEYMQQKKGETRKTDTRDGEKEKWIECKFFDSKVIN